MSRHLSTLKGMCINADISGDLVKREALGWALARLNELSGSKVDEALRARPEDPRVADLEREVDRLEQLVRYICDRNRIDRDRMVRSFEGLNG